MRHPFSAIQLLTGIPWLYNFDIDTIINFFDKYS